MEQRPLKMLVVSFYGYMVILGSRASVKWWTRRAPRSMESLAPLRRLRRSPQNKDKLAAVIREHRFPLQSVRRPILRTETNIQEEMTASSTFAMSCSFTLSEITASCLPLWLTASRGVVPALKILTTNFRPPLLTSGSSLIRYCLVGRL